MFGNQVFVEQQQIKLRSLRLLNYFNCVQWGFLYTGHGSAPDHHLMHRSYDWAGGMFPGDPAAVTQPWPYIRFCANPVSQRRKINRRMYGPRNDPRRV
jgi:hypothetical protein